MLAPQNAAAAWGDLVEVSVAAVAYFQDVNCEERSSALSGGSRRRRWRLDTRLVNMKIIHE